MIYTALINKDSDSDYGVRFPDFPGCITAGKTLEEAKYFAQEALIGHIGLMKDLGQSIPKPSSLDIIMQSQENQGAVVLLVDVPSSKSVRVNVCFAEDVLQVIDKMADQLHMNRSAYLSSLALEKSFFKTKTL